MFHSSIFQGGSVIELSFVILAWNSKRYLERCFDSIVSKCRDESIEFEVIVVDNGSTDGSDTVYSSYTQVYADCVKVIRLDRNVGTTKSRNMALKNAIGKYICVLDSDTEMRSGSLKCVINMLDERRDIGIVAPQLVLNDGTIQNSVKKFPTFLDKLRKIPRVILGLKLLDHDFYTDIPKVGDLEVDTAISACWFFRKDLLKVVGFLDENIFYAPEDVEFCLRIMKSKMTIVYTTRFSVLHHTQQVTHRKPFSPMTLHHLSGLLYYYSKHGGWIIRQNRCKVK